MGRHTRPSPPPGPERTPVHHPLEVDPAGALPPAVRAARAAAQATPARRRAERPPAARAEGVPDDERAERLRMLALLVPLLLVLGGAIGLAFADDGGRATQLPVRSTQVGPGSEGSLERPSGSAGIDPTRSGAPRDAWSGAGPITEADAGSSAGTADATSPSATSPPGSAPPVTGDALGAAAVTSGPPAPDWSTVLAFLDATRTSAFAEGRADLLSRVYLDGSASLVTDAAAVSALSARGLRAIGMRPVIEDVSVLVQASGSVELRVADQLPPYDLVDAAGRVVERRAGRGRAEWTVLLTETEGGWRIASITAQ